jgi:hypothetical protein
LGEGKRIHHSFPNPARTEGSAAEILNVFRSVRDEIATEIPNLLQSR